MVKFGGASRGASSRSGAYKHAPKACQSAPKARQSSAKPAKTAFVYSLNLEGCKKYVGMTQNLEQRLGQHFGGSGAAWTQKYAPVSVNHVQRCKSVKTAKAAESIVYSKMADYHGKSAVRGAGHTAVERPKGAAASAAGLAAIRRQNMV